jgi:hypothetical protein
VQEGQERTVNEGEALEVQGRFHNPEGSDQHEAWWDFGDDSLPQAGIVLQTGVGHEAAGVVTGHHTYCTSGSFLVTLRVRDDDGGVGEDSFRVRVLNVAPMVFTQGTLFAYPGIPVTLMASFVDPGWCDTHTASWRFGDGDFALPATPATVQEVHKAPFGFGLIAATHVYQHLATHEAECVVLDSDGASGRATLRIVVVELMNRHFEQGFYAVSGGQVANEWTPYAARTRGDSTEPTPLLLAEFAPGDSTLFGAEEFVVRDGQRSQRLSLQLGLRTGIFQKVGANVGWDYQLIATYHIDGYCAGRCSLGVDPTGGTDPHSPEVRWSHSETTGSWQKLLLRVTAEQPLVTVFLEGAGHSEVSTCWFDAVKLEPFPARLPPLRRPRLEKFGPPFTRPPQETHGVELADTVPGRTPPTPPLRKGDA